MQLNPPPISIGDEHLKALGYGLSGAHRTGKTTLAAKLAENNNCPFIQTSMSAIATEMGIKIGLDMDFDDRVRFQEEGLTRMLASYEREGEGRLFITDRTPIDLAAYVLTAWHPAVADEGHTLWSEDYVARCMMATNDWFFQLAVIQPGIPWVNAEQKGDNINLYREALNTTIIGLAWDDYIKPCVEVVPRDCVDLKERTHLLTYSYSENISGYVRSCRENFPLQ